MLQILFKFTKCAILFIEVSAVKLLVLAVLRRDGGNENEF